MFYSFQSPNAARSYGRDYQQSGVCLLSTLVDLALQHPVRHTMRHPIRQTVRATTTEHTELDHLLID